MKCDRNLTTDSAVLKTMAYIHNNPVKAGLVKQPQDYYWSSAKYWLEGITDPITLDIPEWWKSDSMQHPYETRD